MDSPPSRPSERCLDCGAALAGSAEWCGQCFAPLAKEEPERTFAAPDAFIGPRLRIRYSRSAKTEVSLGLAGRIVLTLLLVVLPLTYLLSVVLPFGIVYLVAGCPILLAGIWKKTAIRDQDP